MKDSNKRLLFFLLTFVIVIAGTTALTLYARGVRVNVEEKTLTSTGMLSISSNPKGAKAFVDGKLLAITPDSVQSLKPKEYFIEIKKEGFLTWKKKVKVFEEMVTDIDASLISKTPRLEPLTNLGVKTPSLSNNLNLIAYATKGENKPGIWLLPLNSNSPLNIVKTKPRLLVGDEEYPFSESQKIFWSPDDDELLVQLNENNSFLVSLSNNPQNKLLKVPNLEVVLLNWRKILKEKRKILLEKRLINKKMKKYALDPETLWSPDEEKFLYKIKNETFEEYHVYNLAQPLPVGRKKDNLIGSFETGTAPKIYWLTDSNHLIVVENYLVEEGSGDVYMIEYDSENKTEVFSGNLFSDGVFPTPDANGVIVLTSFSPKAEPNLYAIKIR